MHIMGLLRPFGLDFFCLGKKFLVFNMVTRNLKTKYRRSVFGVFWTLLAPLGMAAIYYFVFKVLLKIQVPNYLVFILSGVFFWNFFSQTLMEGMESIVGNWGLVSKVPIPIQVFPFVGAITNLVTLFLALPILFGAALLSGGLTPVAGMLLLYLFVLFLIAYGLSLILGVAFVYFRDLRHAMGILLQLWFYSTPVIYDEAMIPEKYRWILVLNPLGTLFSNVHRTMARGELPLRADLFIMFTWAAVIVFGALMVQRYFSKGLVEQI